MDKEDNKVQTQTKQKRPTHLVQHNPKLTLKIRTLHRVQGLQPGTATPRPVAAYLAASWFNLSTAIILCSFGLTTYSPTHKIHISYKSDHTPRREAARGEPQAEMLKMQIRGFEKHRKIEAI